MGKQNPFQLDVVSVRLVRDAPIFSEQKIVNPGDYEKISVNYILL